MLKEKIKLCIIEFKMMNLLSYFTQFDKPMLKSTLDNIMITHKLTKEDVEYFFKNGIINVDFDIDIMVKLKSLDISLYKPRFRQGYRSDHFPHIERNLNNNTEIVTYSPGVIKSVSMEKENDWGLMNEYLYTIVHDDGTKDCNVFEHAIMKSEKINKSED